MTFVAGQILNVVHLRVLMMKTMVMVYCACLNHCCVCVAVYIMLSCTFRYGRDGGDVMGWPFQRDVYVCTRQVYPPLQDRERSIHTKLQDRLLRKLGDHAHPFFFEVTAKSSNSKNLKSNAQLLVHVAVNRTYD